MKAFATSNQKCKFVTKYRQNDLYSNLKCYISDTQ